MAQTQLKTQVEFGGANSIAVALGGAQEDSDVVTLDPTCIKASVTLKANSGAGTPGVNDLLYVYYAGSCGDPDTDPDVTDEYPGVPENMKRLAVIDCSKANPGVQTVAYPHSPKTGKVIGVTHGSSTAAITFSAQVEQDLSSS